MNNTTLVEQLQSGKVLLFDKPVYWTSFDLVNKVKSIIKHKLKLPQLKIGHAGTLDPLATGLMVICTGKETKNIEKYQAEPKEYIAQIKLGATTPSYDLETEINAEYPTEHIDKQMVTKILEGFTGILMQIPPNYSAKFINGTRAYKLARQGKAVEMQPKEINIYSISLVSFHLPIIQIKVQCSKGTYIRALARDIGSKLDTGAHLIGLKRTSIGNFLLKDAISIEEFERNLIFL
jgi:tRNA pseudouridine55 synthase